MPKRKPKKLEIVIHGLKSRADAAEIYDEIENKLEDIRDSGCGPLGFWTDGPNIAEDNVEEEN